MVHDLNHQELMELIDLCDHVATVGTEEDHDAKLGKSLYIKILDDKKGNVER